MYVFGGGDGKYWLNDLLVLDLGEKKDFLKSLKIHIYIGPKEKMTWSIKETQGKRPSKFFPFT
jgi:hypothetical protein